MTKEIVYTDGPMEEVLEVVDFLPSPSELVFREDDTVKVTISLSRASVVFFKREAQRNHVPYQKMIRRLLDEYARRYSG